MCCTPLDHVPPWGRIKELFSDTRSCFVFLVPGRGETCQKNKLMEVEQGGFLWFTHKVSRHSRCHACLQFEVAPCVPKAGSSKGQLAPMRSRSLGWGKADTREGNRFWFPPRPWLYYQILLASIQRRLGKTACDRELFRQSLLIPIDTIAPKGLGHRCPRHQCQFDVLGERKS